MYRLEFSKEALHSIAVYKRSNKKAYNKITMLLQEMQEHPRTGTGHPEPLIGSNNKTYSRRITKKDRLIYDIYDEIVTVLVISVDGHYDDK